MSFIGEKSPLAKVNVLLQYRCLKVIYDKSGYVYVKIKLVRANLLWQIDEVPLGNFLIFQSFFGQISFGKSAKFLSETSRNFSLFVGQISFGIRSHHLTPSIFGIRYPHPLSVEIQSLY